MKNHNQPLELATRSKLLQLIKPSLRAALIMGFLLYLLPLQLSAQWTLNNPATQVIRDLESNGRDLYAVGDQGLILKRNAGVETIFNAGVTTNFTAITFTGTSTILAVGADKVVRSTDGGTTWNVATIAGSPSLQDIVMQNTTTGWTVGLSGKIFKTTDGGATWTAQTSNTTNALYSVSFSSGFVIAVGASRTVCQSSNGGTTWSVSTPGSGTNNFHSVAGTSFIVGTNGLILKSTDNGVTWTAKTSGTTAKLNKLTSYYISGNVGYYIVGDGGIVLRSTNAGETWVNVPSGRTDNFTAVEGALYYEGAGSTLSGGDEYLATSTKGMMIADTPCLAAPYSSNIPPATISGCIGDDVVIAAFGGGNVSTRILKKSGVVVDLDGNTSAHTTMTLKNIQTSQAGTYTIEVTNPCGNLTSSTFTVAVNDVPAMPSVIAGSATPTQSVYTPYSVTNVVGNTYAWSGGTDALVVPSGNSASITWNFPNALGAKTITVTPSNTCGAGSPRTLNVTAQPPVLSPALDAVNVPVNSNLTITFGSPVSLFTTEIITIYRASDNSVFETYTIPSGSVSTAGGVVTINPTANFENAVEYRVDVDNRAVFNQAGSSTSYYPGGSSVGKTAVFRFTTAAAVDGTPPNISSYSPADGATGVAVTSNLVATFSENVTAVTSKVVSIRRSSDNSVFESYTLPSTNVVMSGSTVTINPSGSLLSLTGYYVNIDAGAFEDAAGNDFAGITNTTTWNFTTGDGTPPTITALSPLDDATGVSVSANLVATFSENISAVATRTIYIYRTSDNAIFGSYTLPSTYVVVSGNTITINPLSDFAPSTSYYVNIATGAFEDAAGNDFVGILNNSTWNFTTADGTPPTLMSVSPVDNAADVAVATNLVATFSENITAVSTKVVSIKRISDNAVFESYTLPHGNVVVSGTTVTINPTGSLANSTGYYVNMDAGAFEDAAGNDFAGVINNSTWNFTTVAAADGTPPTILSFTPADNSTDIALAATLFCSFTESIIPVASKVVSIKRVADNSIFESYTLPSANVTVAGTDLIINPTALLLNSTGYYVSIDAGAFEDAAGNDFAGILTTTTWNFTTVAPTLQNQTITFNPLATKTFGDAAFGLTASASSGLPVSYASSNTAVATVSGSTVTLVGAGSATITASQAGNGSYNPAPNVQQTLTVNKANQTITFAALASKTFGDGNFTLNAASNSGLGVSYSSSNTAVATISGNTVTIVGAGSTTITASQAGNSNYNAASDAQQLLTVNKANQTITFNALATKTFGDANFGLSATASSALAITYTSSNTAVATVSGSTVTIVGVGSTTITATQAGNGNYNAATAAQQTLTVNKSNQSISFSPLAAKTFGDANFGLSATASSALAITYTSSNTSVATISGNTVTLVGAGSAIISASQAGNVNYNAAITVDQTLTVNKAAQTITFSALAAKTFDDADFNLAATSSAGLPISYSSSNTAVATISGSTVSIIGAGTSVITASQSGNANYNAATSAQQTLTVNKASQTITFNALPAKQVGDSPFTLSASASSGLTINYSSSNTTVATVSGSTLTIVGVGTSIITATQAGNTNYNAASSVNQGITVTSGLPPMAMQSVSPLDNATNVDGEINLSITFNQNVNVGAGTLSVFRSDNDVLITSLSNLPSQVTISGATVTFNLPVNLPSGVGVYVNITSGYIRSAADAGNTFAGISDKTTWNFTIGKLSQSISFGALANKSFGDAAFALTATANSGLSVSYNSSDATVATVSGNTVTIVGVGSTTITASQSGNATYNPASSVNQTLTVSKGNQTITFGALATKTFGDANFSVSASASSGLPISYVSSNTSVATVSGNTITIVGAGTATLTASQSGNANYNAATNVNQLLTVDKSAQTIAFGALPSKTFDDDNFNLSATASSTLSVAYSSSNTSVATVSGNVVTIVGVGSTTITASQAGNINYLAAPSVDQPLTVSKAAQTITFSALATKTFGDTSFDLAASASSGLALSYVSSNTSVVTISGNKVTIVGAGSANITASQGGNANYNAATPVVRALTVNKADQTISFGSLAAKGVGAPPFSLDAVATSGLTVSYISSNTAVATVSGSTVTIIGQGTTTITASQAGNANYNAASSVGQSLTVNSKQNQLITFNALAAKTFGDAAFTLTATSSSALPVTFASSNPSVATVSGSTVTIVGAGAATITALQAGDVTYNAASVPRSLVVNKANQTITFNALAAQQLSTGSIQLSATASSGLAVSFSSSNTSVATVSATTVSFLATGTTTITASQSGNDNFNAATVVTQTLIIADKQTQMITFGALADKTFGDAAFNLTATSSSALAVSYTSSNTSVATISGSTVTIVGAGSSVIKASQAGNTQFNAATDVEQTLVVKKANQVITFGALTGRGLNQGVFNLTANSNSGLAVSFVSSNTAVATISGNTVTPIRAGTVTITASQSGNTNYNAAASVSQSLVIIDDTPTRIINVSEGLKFDELIIPETASKTFTITNNGNDKLTISAITFPEGYSGDKTSGSIAAGGSLVVTVTFAPTQTKEYAGVISITSNATSGLASLNVIGKGITITAIEDALGLKPMNVFPNPGRGIYTLNIKQPQSKQAVVIDALGRTVGLVNLQPSGEDLYQVDITSMRQGDYFIKLPADQKVKMVRVIKID